ncbi:MAG: hypothetical protein HY976_04160 [Candidatus Kerfeldbacteria bacterium]|nr:hypothetical protein [Candidatus Kerfeldbacteria bacterium]
MTASRHHGAASRGESSDIIVRVPSEIGQYVKESFLVSLLTYVIFTLIDRLVPGFVSRVINLDIVLGVVIVLGAMTAWLVERERGLDESQPGQSIRSLGFIVGAGLISALIVWLRTASLGWINLPLSVMSGLIVAGLTWFFLDSETFPDQDSSH